MLNNTFISGIIKGQKQKTTVQSILSGVPVSPQNKLNMERIKYGKKNMH